MGNSRVQICEAVLDLITEQPLEAIEVEQIVERAGIDRGEFERYFADLQDCVLQLYRETTEAFLVKVMDAYQGEGAWRDRLRAAAYVAARYLRDHPREIRLYAIQFVSLGDMVLIERDRYHAELVSLIDEGRAELEDPESISRSVAEGVIGSILTMLAREVDATGGATAAEDFVPPLMYIAVLPYLGEDAARDELTIPPPPE